MDERKAYWFEQPYMPQMKNIAVAPVILEDGRLSFCVPGDDGCVCGLPAINRQRIDFTLTADANAKSTSILN